MKKAPYYHLISIYKHKKKNIPQIMLYNPRHRGRTIKQQAKYQLLTEMKYQVLYRTVFLFLWYYFVYQSHYTLKVSFCNTEFSAGALVIKKQNLLQHRNWIWTSYELDNQN